MEILLQYLSEKLSSTYFLFPLTRVFLARKTRYEKSHVRGSENRFIIFMSHTQSIEKEIKKYAAEYIAREAARQSLITITRCEINTDGKHAVLFISVLPERAEPIAMDFLKRHQDDIRRYVVQSAKIRAVPWLRFSLDKGEKNRQIVDRLLQEDEK